MIATLNQPFLGLEEHVESLARKARLAAAVFTQYSQQEVDRIVKAMTIAAVDSSYLLAREAHKETRMGVVEDKVLKNRVASEFHYHQIKNAKTVGVIRHILESNMMEVAEPVGVILALTPVTNPTSTVIFKAIAAAKTRNSVIFSPHLMAANSSNLAAQILYEAALKAGAPKGFISWVEKSPRLRRQTEMLMMHPEVDLIFATGGAQMVQAAYSSGKPALGVGAGNTPVYIHKSAAVESAVMDVIISKTFDNGAECPSEQTLVIDAEIVERVIAEFRRLGCYVCSSDEVGKVAAVAFDPVRGGMNYKLVGQPAKTIADRAGISVSADTKILLCPLEGILADHPLVQEKLMPVLGYVAVNGPDEGINRALDINYAGGTGHTAGIFASDDDVVERYAVAVNAGRIIVNSPTSIGGLGGVYNNLNTTLSFGCGTGGGNITTDNVGIKNLLNYKRVPARKKYDVPSPVEQELYEGAGSLDKLKTLAAKSAFIVSCKSALRSGLLAQAQAALPRNCRVHVTTELGSEPNWDSIQKGIAEMRLARPDTIIALGGGSVMDAAKIMRLFYDHPDLRMEDIAINFLDINQRIADYPRGACTSLVAIPTTSGTGSEATPFAVFAEGSRKITLVDQSLVPNIVVLDPRATQTLPATTVIDTATDALTHCLEALVSTIATAKTDRLALDALRLIFEALPQAAGAAEAGAEEKHKLQRAAYLAGRAIGSASVGVNHALAHALGARYHIPHGRANGVFLLDTIGYNSEIPAKFMPNSMYKLYVADWKYALAADVLMGASFCAESAHAGGSYAERVLELRRAVYDLLAPLRQPLSIFELGISKEQFEQDLPELVSCAFEDMASGTNPRAVLISELYELYRQAYPQRRRP